MLRKTVCLVIGLALLAGAPSVAHAGGDAEAFALMLGANEVPPVRTDGFGIAYFYIPRDQSFIYYFVLYGELEGRATAANIHSGSARENGPIMFGLRGIPGGASGLYDGFLTRENFMPNRQVQTYEQAVGAILRSLAYVNIQSSVYPRGEVRGQTFRLED